VQGRCGTTVGKRSQHVTHGLPSQKQNKHPLTVTENFFPAKSYCIPFGRLTIVRGIRLFVVADLDLDIYCGLAGKFFFFNVSMYSQTCLSDHPYIATTCTSDHLFSTPLRFPYIIYLYIVTTCLTRPETTRFPTKTVANLPITTGSLSVRQAKV
jgi:hypothetical protein